jgi:hypothetical protein
MAHEIETHEIPFLAAEECLDFRKGGCLGAVLMRGSLTGTGTAIPRCDRHWVLRLEKEAEHREVYPDSPNPPSWFDPTYAGERWDDD